MAANHDISTDLDPQLYYKAEQGNIQAQNELCNLARNGWVSSEGWKPIQFAAANGHVNLVELLARERQQDLYARQGDGWNLLHWAAFNGHLEVAKLLVREFEFKIHVDEKD